MTPATSLDDDPDADMHPVRPAAASRGPMHDAWRVLWAVPALVMVALRLSAPEAWAALALLIASIAVLNADGLARWARRPSRRSPASRDGGGGREGIA